MAVVTIHNQNNGDQYQVDNALNRKAIRRVAVAGNNDEVYRMILLSFDLETMTYQVKLQKRHATADDSWESAGLSNMGISSDIDPSWVNSPNVNVRKLKADALNNWFINEGITDDAPLSLTDFSVQAPYDTAPA